MRKVLVGIAAALMLTTLVIAIVPAFAQIVYYGPTYTFIDVKAGVGLDVYVVPGKPIIFYLYPLGDSVNLCDGMGGTVKGGYLVLLGACVNPKWLPTTPPNYPYPDVNAGKGVLAGGGKIATGIVVTLTVVGKPPMVYKYYMVLLEL
jgi:hypothetical protein